MRRFHFDANHISNGTVILDKEESHHALNVLRMKEGSVIELLDGNGGTYGGVVLGETGGRLSVKVWKTDVFRRLPVEVTLAVSVIKPERMDFLIEKVSELGVSAFIPMITARTVVKLSAERWQSKITRWKKIAAAACKQCGRASACDIRPVQKFATVLAQAQSFDRVLIPTLDGSTRPLFEVLENSPAKRPLVLLGPEGDFTHEEIEAAKAALAQPVSLGPLVMRTETAALYVLSAIHYNALSRPHAS